jgi:hypothetical protein
MQDSPASRKRRRSQGGVEDGECEAGALPGAATPVSGGGGALASLQGCVEALGTSVNATMARLSGSLASSVSMMQTMNAMMEDYVMRSLSVSASWDRAGLRVRVANQSRMPVEGVQVAVRLLADDDAPGPLRRPVQLATLDVLAAGDAAELPVDLRASLGQGAGVADTAESTGADAAGKGEGELLAALLHSAVEVSLEFASPGTGEPLRVLARLPMLLWDRMSQADVADASTVSHWTSGRERVNMSADAARRLLWLSAFDALALPASRVASLALPGLADALVFELRAERLEGSEGEVAVGVNVDAQPNFGHDLRPYLDALHDDLRRFRARHAEPLGAAAPAHARYKYERTTRAS